MGMFLYLLMGMVMYVAGIMIYIKRLKPNKTQQGRYKVTDPILRPYLLGCAVLMVVISVVISLFVLKHQPLDVVYVLVNSVVATVVFYFGLNPDDTNLKLPD
ncbi:MAG: hypothetical protein Q4C68_00995 [Moraxella sp.]|nr:hypothetical protein [Moraxella sp.]